MTRWLANPVLMLSDLSIDFPGGRSSSKMLSRSQMGMQRQPHHLGNQARHSRAKSSTNLDTPRIPCWTSLPNELWGQIMGHALWTKAAQPVEYNISPMLEINCLGINRSTRQAALDVLRMRHVFVNAVLDDCALSRGTEEEIKKNLATAFPCSSILHQMRHDETYGLAWIDVHAMCGHHRDCSPVSIKYYFVAESCSLLDLNTQLWRQVHMHRESKIVEIKCHPTNAFGLSEIVRRLRDLNSMICGPENLDLFVTCPGHPENGDKEYAPKRRTSPTRLFGRMCTFAIPYMEMLQDLIHEGVAPHAMLPGVIRFMGRFEDIVYLENDSIWGLNDLTTRRRINARHYTLIFAALADFLLCQWNTVRQQQHYVLYWEGKEHLASLDKLWYETDSFTGVTWWDEIPAEDETGPLQNSLSELLMVRQRALLFLAMARAATLGERRYDKLRVDLKHCPCRLRRRLAGFHIKLCRREVFSAQCACPRKPRWAYDSPVYFLRRARIDVFWLKRFDVHESPHKESLERCFAELEDLARALEEAVSEHVCTKLPILVQPVKVRNILPISWTTLGHTTTPLLESCLKLLEKQTS